ncbi:MAG: geranyl transferase [Gammaproteobacteria bacterium]|nr:geranyl transferase [Gammaproteobacteria bacterium]
MNSELIDIREAIEHKLDELLPKESLIAQKLVDAMRYATLTGGKRIRPMLLCASCTGFGGTLEQALVPACAIELIHTYSLIHDDLPSMDNDDLRHGKPATHIAFGEPIAILTGDALQALAFDLLAGPHTEIPGSARIESIRLLSQGAGWNGMVGGQLLDLQSENQTLTLEQLRRLHEAKTGALITAAIQIGVAIAGTAEKKTIRTIDTFARKIGLAFQIVDDILDESESTTVLGKPANSDTELNKSTFPKLLGIQPSKKFAEQLVEEAVQLLAAENLKNSLLVDLAKICVQRRY